LQKKSKKKKNKDDTLELKELSDSRSKFDKKTRFTGGSSNNNHLINRSLDQLDNDPIQPEKSFNYHNSVQQPPANPVI